MNKDHTSQSCAFDVIVVGAGIMGASTAYHLAKDGVKVLLLEQFAIGHAKGSSHGPSRIIRLAYDTLDYVTLAQAAYQLWGEIEAESRQTLLTKVGGLDIGVPDALGLLGIRECYEAASIAYDALDADDIMQRFPQFCLPQDMIGFYQPDYSLLAADQCVLTYVAQAQQHGAQIQTNEAVREIKIVGNGVEVVSDRGSYSAARVVLCAGSWVQGLLAKLDLRLPLTIHKEQVLFLKPRNPADFMPGRFPLFIHRFPGTTSLGSGFPIHHHSAPKFMIDRVGPTVSPEDSDRSLDIANIARVTAYATQMLPDLTSELVEAVSCRYTMTPDEDFIIDRHPAYSQVVIASPCSGHGFKFGSVLGRILADLATQGHTAYNIDRFRLNRF